MIAYWKAFVLYLRLDAYSILSGSPQEEPQSWIYPFGVSPSAVRPRDAPGAARREGGVGGRR